MKVDLHAHTTRSDGSAPPRALVRLAREAGLDVLAVTDHDTIEAVPECLDEARSYPLRILPGIEMSSRFEKRDVHVLGYGLDFESAELRNRLDELKASRRERIRTICARLAEHGISLDPGKILEGAGEGSVGRPHVARALIETGAVADVGEAFRKWLGPGCPGNVPANDLSPKEAAELIETHGGIPVLAHPGFLDDDPLVERILDAAPIRGVEVFHRYRSPRKHLRYLDIARRRALLVTGGSDFHGSDAAEECGLGSVTCPPQFWKDLEMRLGAG